MRFKCYCHCHYVCVPENISQEMSTTTYYISSNIENTDHQLVTGCPQCSGHHQGAMHEPN